MHPTMKKRAYAYIRDKLVMGTIPQGERLSDAGIARELGVSRTPVREALVQLEADGLIEQQPGVGPRTKALDRRELEEFFELREILECSAASIAAKRITDQELSGLEELCRQYDSIVARMRDSDAEDA